MDWTGRYLDREQHVQTPQEDCVHGEKSTASTPLA
jgi:hypothetical protein